MVNPDLWLVAALAILQGLTEFLPVSSSGHLVIFENLSGMRSAISNKGILLEVIVHAGTLGAVIIFYREKIGRLLRAIRAATSAKGREKYKDEIRYISYIVLGTMPAAMVGAIFNERIEKLFDEPLFVSMMLIATGLFLFSSRFGRGSRELSLWIALAIGVAQALAIVPGISRSGWTITTGLLLGLGFAEAAEFAFVLSIPAISGAMGLELLSEAPKMETAGYTVLIFAAIVSFLSGLFALKFLLRVLEKSALHKFAWYLVPLGALCALYFAFGS